MSGPIETFKVGSKTVELYPDPDCENPREDAESRLGTILYCKGSRYILGDKAVDRDEIAEILNRKDVICLPVYAYIHSGVALNTTGFSCPWDSGQSGVIYMTFAEARAFYQRKRITKAFIQTVYKAFAAEIKTFGEYINGECYGYMVKDENGEDLDSCWGFVGYEYAKQEATSAAA